MTFCCWGPIPIMKLDIFAGTIGFDQSLGPFSFQQHITFKATTQKTDKYYLLLSSAFNKYVDFSDSRLGDGQRWLWKRATAFKISTKKVLGPVWSSKKSSSLGFVVFWNSLGCFLEGSSVLPTLCHKLWRMIGSTVRYFILQRISLWSEFCVFELRVRVVQGNPEETMITPRKYDS